MKDTLLQICEDNEYLHKYISLIEENRGTKNIKGLTNRHHIIPRYYYKFIGQEVNNYKCNVINLKVSDHILAHYYLALCSRTPWFRFCNEVALKMMLGESRELSESWLTENAPLLDELYRDQNELYQNICYVHMGDTTKRILIEQRDSFLEEGWEIGKSDWINKKCGGLNKGKSASQETRDKLSMSHTGKKHIFKEDVEKVVDKCDLDIYLNDGWSLGRSKYNCKQISKGSFGKPGTFKGKTQSESARKAIGRGNSGGCYINKDGVVRHIHDNELQEFLELGWSIGNPNSSKCGDYFFVSNEYETKRIAKQDLQKYLDMGYIRGRKKKIPDGKDVNDLTKEEFDKLEVI